jgi:hypothetical protein
VLIVEAFTQRLPAILAIYIARCSFQRANTWHGFQKCAFKATAEGQTFLIGECHWYTALRVHAPPILNFLKMWFSFWSTFINICFGLFGHYQVSLLCDGTAVLPMCWFRSFIRMRYYHLCASVSPSDGPLSTWVMCVFSWLFLLSPCVYRATSQ